MREKIKKMDREQIYETCVSRLVEEFELAKESITLDANLFTDLNLDSIDMLDLIVQLEEDYELEIVEEEIKKVQTIGDFIDYVLRFSDGGSKADA